MLQGKIEILKRELITYGVFVQSMIEKSVHGLLEKDTELFRRLIEQDEPRANAFELELDELCTTSIAQYDPKAKDLRTILMILRINNDLERMADHAVNIAECGIFLVELPAVKPLIDIPKMSNDVLNMVSGSISAFVNNDVLNAKNVCLSDTAIDDSKDKILRELISFMSADPTTIERSLSLIRISHELERIADLSTNICEDVIYMVEGTVIKHHNQSTP